MDTKKLALYRKMYSAIKNAANNSQLKSLSDSLDLQYRTKAMDYADFFALSGLIRDEMNKEESE